MKKVNEIVISKNNYDNDEHSFQEAIKKAVMLLIENEYIATVRYDEASLGIVIIEYETTHRDWGAPYPYWLDSDEYEDFVLYKEFNASNVNEQAGEDDE